MEKPGPSINPDGTVKVTVELTESDITTLRRISANTGETMTQSLRKAIATENFIRDIFNRGAEIYVRNNPDSSRLRELILIDEAQTPKPRQSVLGRLFSRIRRS